MPYDTATSPLPISWGAASRAAPGQDVCGDLHLVKPTADGVLLAVVDGLGHGEEAAVAARTALAEVDCHAEAPLKAIVQHCHQALTKTRGVVMTLAMVHPREDRLSWLGIGNVEAALLRRDGHSKPQVQRAIMLGRGVVGYQMPELCARTIPISPGDVLVLASDGIDAGFTEAVVSSDPAQRAAERILQRFFKGADDALVLVACYLGGGHE